MGLDVVAEWSWSFIGVEVEDGAAGEASGQICVGFMIPADKNNMCWWRRTDGNRVRSLGLDECGVDDVVAEVSDLDGWVGVAPPGEAAEEGDSIVICCER